MAVRSVRRFGKRLLSRQNPEVRYLVLVRVVHPEIVDSIRDLATTFSLPPADVRLPHITLFGPFTLAGRATATDILECIEGAAGKVDDTTYSPADLLELQGRKGKAIVCRVVFPEEMDRAYREISSCFLPLAANCTWLDREPERRVIHITLAFNLRARLACRVREYIVKTASRRKDAIPGNIFNPVRGELKAPGIAVLRNGMLWKEYDLARKTWRERKDLYPLFNF
jgi:hypothetical protein